VQYLSFDLSCVTTLEALASTAAEQHGAVMAEVQQVLDWAWRHYPHSHGPLDDGMDWDDDLQVQVEDGRWHAVSLTLAGSARFIEAFSAAFDQPQD
jgi:VCBS repeat-containing protein